MNLMTDKSTRVAAGMAAMFIAALFATGALLAVGAFSAIGVEAQTGPNITLGPDNGGRGDIFIITGTGFMASTGHIITVNFGMDNNTPSTVVTTVNTDGDGAFLTTITVPDDDKVARGEKSIGIAAAAMPGDNIAPVGTPMFTVEFPTDVSASPSSVDNSTNRYVKIYAESFEDDASGDGDSLAGAVTFSVSHEDSSQNKDLDFTSGDGDDTMVTDNRVTTNSEGDIAKNSVYLKIPADTPAGIITVTATDNATTANTDSVTITVTEASLMVDREEIPNGQQVSITVSGGMFPEGNVMFATHGVDAMGKPDGTVESADDIRLVGGIDTITRSVADGGSFTHRLTFKGQDIGATFFIVATEANDASAADENVPGYAGTMASVMITAKVVAPAPVTGLSVTPGNEQLFVSWNHSVGADNYHVRWRVQSGTEYSSETVASNAFTIVDLIGSTSYIVEVRPNRLNALAGVYSTIIGVPTGTPGRVVPTPTPAPTIPGTTPAPTPVAPTPTPTSGSAPTLATEDAILNTDEADTVTRLTIVGNGGQLGTVGPGDEIMINLEGFGLPSNIDEADVTIDDGNNRANPESVTTSGDDVTILLGKFTSSQPNSHMDNIIDASDRRIAITVRDRAGITTPNRAGPYAVRVDAKDINDQDGYDLDGVNMAVSIIRSISVSPKSAVRDTVITITGRGYSDGSAMVMAGNMLVGTADVTDGAFTLEANNGFKVNNNNAFVSGSAGTNVNVTDGAGGMAATVANHKIKAAFSVEPRSPNPGQEVVLTLLDTEIMGSSSVTASFGGGTSVAVTNTNDGDNTTWKLVVPSNVRRGIIVMSVTVDSMAALTKNITIAINVLEVVPSVVVPGQEVSVTGSGFKDGGTIGVGDVQIGSIAANTVALSVNNTGNVSFSVTVPGGVPSGEIKVVVTDAVGRVGEARIDVAEPVLTLSPAESHISSDLVVGGTGFPANDLVLIKYNGNVVTTATANSVGSFEKTMVVPSSTDVSPGGSYDVMAQSQINNVVVSASEKHRTPRPTVSLPSSSVAAGSNLVVNGANFRGFSQLYRVEINGQNVTPVPAPSTDRWGAFTVTVLVPQLTPGRYVVKVIVGGVGGDSVAEPLQIIEAVVVVLTDPADVFRGLIDADRLVRVWHLDRANQRWLAYDPAPEFADFNDLTLVSSEQVVSIIITDGEPIEFQNITLYQGANPISLR